MTSKTRLCECGCGKPTQPAARDYPKSGIRKGECVRFLPGHSLRKARFAGYRTTNRAGYVLLYHPEHPRANQKGYVFEHILVVESALGHALRAAAQVHHVNGVTDDNRPSNLVVCQDAAHHRLIHQRQLAFAACGHADWLQCFFCKSWGPPEAVRRFARSWKGFHAQCRRDYARNHRRRKLGIPERLWRKP